MSKRAECSSSSSSNSQPTLKRMDNEVDTDSPLSLKVTLDKLSAIASRMEDNFHNLLTEVSTLRCELMQEMKGVKCTIKEIEKSLENAWATIEDVQEDFKTHKDSKRTHQEMLERQSREIKLLKEELAKSQAETALLKTSQQRTQESLVALEDYTRRENLRFMNIPEEADENCSDIVYNIIENELKIDPQDIRFHAVHRVGKPPSRNSDNNTSPRHHCKVRREGRQRRGFCR